MVFFFDRDDGSLAAAPGGETFRELFKRATRPLEQILARKHDRPRTLLIAAHGVTNRALAGHVRQLHLDQAFALESQPGDRMGMVSKTRSGFSEPIAKAY